MPVPDRLTVCGLPGALSVNDSVPVRSPFCVGVKLTFTMQLLPAASVLPHFSFDVNENSAKSPVVAMLVMLSVAVPVLVTVTFFLPAAVVPTRILPHVREVGVRLTTGPPLPVIVSCRVVWCDKLPDTPVMVTVDVPVGVPAGTVRVNVLVVVAGFGEKPAVTPLGIPVALRFTLPLKPLIGVMVMVLVPLLPCAMLTELGFADRLKSGDPPPPQLGKMKLPMAVLQLKPWFWPVVLMYDSVNQKVQSSVGSTVSEL